MLIVTGGVFKKQGSERLLYSTEVIGPFCVAILCTQIFIADSQRLSRWFSAEGWRSLEAVQEGCFASSKLQRV